MGIPQAAAARPTRRRSDAGHVRLQQRDLDGLLLIADHYAAPYDLLAAALSAQPSRLRGITAWHRVRHRARPHQSQALRSVQRASPLPAGKAPDHLGNHHHRHPGIVKSPRHRPPHRQRQPVWNLANAMPHTTRTAHTHNYGRFSPMLIGDILLLSRGRATFAVKARVTCRHLAVISERAAVAGGRVRWRKRSGRRRRRRRAGGVRVGGLAGAVGVIGSVGAGSRIFHAADSPGSAV
jgi:hypothetical protein